MSWIIKKEKWLEWYNYIRKTLNLTFERDQEATNFLSSLLKEKRVLTFCDLLVKFSKFKRAAIFGAGPSLEQSYAIVENLDESTVMISSDGATSFLIEKNVIPHIVVTDLDGDIRDLMYANKEGAITVIHGHGDNIDQLKKYVKFFSGHVMGSTQVEPRPFVYNFGGFTDGDRGVFLAAFLNIRNILLVGMDFGSVVGKYSKPWLKSSQQASEIKRKKLRIAQELVNWIAKERKLNVKYIKP
ncbi:MAG: 6-hydroxymethylpterin diphosphokinase MptE-like protein [Candidatus Baldrarchaeia archaeon]